MKQVVINKCHIHWRIYPIVCLTNYFCTMWHIFGKSWIHIWWLLFLYFPMNNTVKHQWGSFWLLHCKLYILFPLLIDVKGYFSFTFPLPTLFHSIHFISLSQLMTQNKSWSINVTYIAGCKCVCKCIPHLLSWYFQYGNHGSIYDYHVNIRKKPWSINVTYIGGCPRLFFKPFFGQCHMLFGKSWMCIWWSY